MPWLLVLIALLISFTGADAKKSQHPKDKKPQLDEQTETLLLQLASRPELMNLGYLQYIIGSPESPQRNTASPSNFWYDAGRNLKYELHQKEQTRGQVTESTFIAHVSYANISFDDIDKKYAQDGRVGKHFYDQKVLPAEMFQFHPNTSLIFSSLPNTFQVDEAKIEYSGPPLPQPTTEDLTMAKEGLLNRALLLESQGDYADAIPLLQQTLVDHPNNGYAHLALARAMKNQGAVMPAADQYRAALSLSNGDDALRDQAMAGLQGLQVIPSAQSQSQSQKQPRIVRKGQTLKVGGSTKQNPPNNNPPSDPLFTPQAPQ